MPTFSRRTLLLAGVAGVTAFTATAAARPSDPFTLGVASGDPTPDGVVLWTRLALEPLAEDGRGGMPGRPIEVRWQVADDERFTRIVQQGSTLARPEDGHSVHLELTGLEPGREYFYRFRALNHLSRTGRTRTAPPPEALQVPLTMAFASCAQYEHGYFTAYRRLAEDEPDLVLHLGDYTYEYEAGIHVAPTGNVRHIEGPTTTTLADYRRRQAQYKSDPDLQAAHAAAPWAVIWDDHEIANNWAGLQPDTPQADFAKRRAAAFQAYYENMPVRRSPRLYRRIRWGSLATFHMLDTRQYRTDQACGDGLQLCLERLAPERTMLGADQEKWLFNGFRESTARWDVLGQQVFFSQYDYIPGDVDKFLLDAWDGYVADRDRVVAGLAGVRNPIVLTGDVHAAWGAEVKQRWDDPSSKTLATELVTTSITAGGDGSEEYEETPLWLKENPHVKYFNNRRGYTLTRFTPDELRTDFRGLDHVTRPGSPVHTKASFAVEDRVPGLHRL
ncbi:alkaline phosphatase D [Lentzea atacamensis]|uniref:Alkaline phosphatase D n=1 Tax=Lentzea atacamensis TaxID=531938 RepID=A0ABX9EDS3_9PSEU|nr:alkaline phosphatase D family protein [Lentzea atacamensis]RAS68787.1 alkaline phosphatase D [Lentzea atacamensis]